MVTVKFSSVNILRTIKLYTLKGRILWFGNYISTKLLLKKYRFVINFQRGRVRASFPAVPQITKTRLVGNVVGCRVWTLASDIPRFASRLLTTVCP